jgi:hypothetical protein
MHPIPLQQFAVSLKEIIAKGFTIEPATERYIHSTFSHPGAADVLAILNDETDCERDSLVELIFFPDEALQVGLEGQLEAGAFGAEDERRLLAMLLAEPLETALIFPATHETFALRMPQLALRRFVTRLHIPYRLDRRLCRILDQRIAPELRQIIKVKLRNARIRFSEIQGEFLGRFLASLDARHTDYLDCLALLLTIGAEIGPTTDIYKLLTEMKRTYFQSLEKAEEFQRRLGRSNMETLMLQGFRPAFIDPADGRKKMRLIDTICQAVFGRSEYFAKAEARDLDLDQASGDESLRKVLDLLS